MSDIVDALAESPTRTRPRTPPRARAGTGGRWSAGSWPARARSVVRPVGRAIVTLAIAVVLAFLLIEIIPGDPAVRVAGTGASQERVAEVRSQLGLDRPIHERFGDFVGGLLRGDLGTSLTSPNSVSTMIGQRLVPTGSIILLSTLLGCVIGSLLAVYSARRAGRLGDRMVASGFALTLAVPGILTGYLLTYFFAVRLDILPTFGYVSPSESIGQWLHHIIAPAFVVSIGTTVMVGRQLRGTLVDEFNGDIVRFARARGLPRRLVLRRHALRQAFVPVVPLLAVDIAFQLSGVIVVETVFNIPGTGTLLVKAVTDRDFPVIQGMVVVLAVWVSLVNLVADAVVKWLDPRMKFVS